MKPHKFKKFKELEAFKELHQGLTPLQYYAMAQIIASDPAFRDKVEDVVNCLLDEGDK